MRTVHPCVFPIRGCSPCFTLIVVTIDSPTHPNPPRVSIPHQTPALESSHNTPPSFSSAPLNVSPISRTATQSTSLVPSTRSRSELEEGDSESVGSPSHLAAYSSGPAPLSYLHPSSGIARSLSSAPEPDPELNRARKKQRVDSFSSSTSTSLTAIERSLIPTNSFSSLNNERTTMRLTESDKDSAVSVSFDSVSEAGPSSAAGTSNGHNGTVAKSNGFTQSFTNGSSKTLLSDGADGSVRENHNTSIARVSLPGTTLYDDSYVDREEFVRLVIQSLRDVGYMYVCTRLFCVYLADPIASYRSESAATLEAESGYIMETPEVAEFRKCILDAYWDSAEAALMRLGVAEGERLWEAKFLISQQKYLELLEAHKTTAALQVLRNELAPLKVEPEQLHALSRFVLRATYDTLLSMKFTVLIFLSLMMCSDSADLRHRAGWDGAAGTSRRRLLVNLQRYIPSSVMIPQRRFATLLDQARSYQQGKCLYHNLPLSARTFSLYTDHMCDRNAFPRVTTAILEGHTDEVWNLEWSHSGMFLATASKDKSAIIWRVGSDRDPSIREYSPNLSSEIIHTQSAAWRDFGIQGPIRWQTGLCLRELEAHTEVVTAFAWLPDGSGFISDFTRLVAVGMYDLPLTPPGNNTTPPESGTPPGGGAPAANPPRSKETRIIIYDLATKLPEKSIRLEGELTSVKISQDSQYALINHTMEQGPSCEILLWDLSTEQIARKYTGHVQCRHIIRSCFGGIDDNFVASGSEDGQVYIWHRDNGALLEVLPGHGEGSVNAVAWNPVNVRMFASCSDDMTIRIWEAPPADVLGAPADVRDSEDSAKGKGKSRERWDEDGAGSTYGLGTPTALF
ncbi:WD repeat-containing protein 26 [Grifola frondosa]|uniref:WD repeat-containing protein 26 n=1 Tax=Grifola frondosa TaxID=5627 RepID=A0A1C7MGL2_GRIFR|nr:WD repeat-containing protein 26 [Grifola frondosa]